MHKRWPVLYVGDQISTKIRSSYQNNVWAERPTQPWTPEDFQYVQLEKNLDFDYHIDLSDLLSDKSIIPERGQWIYEYDQQAYRTKYGRFPMGPPPTSRSVIVHYLRRDKITTDEVLDRIQTNTVPDS